MNHYKVEDPSAVYPVHIVHVYAPTPGEAAIHAANAMTGCNVLEDVDQQVMFDLVDSLVVTCLDRVVHWQSALAHINAYNDDRLNAAKAEGMAEQDAAQG